MPLYDDPLVIAGQGTIRMKILKQLPDAKHLNAIFGAIGSSGLVAGISEYVKCIGSPRTCVVATETFDRDTMVCSLEKGKCVTLSEVGPFSDGTAVRIVGEEPFQICKQLLDGVVKVDNDEIRAAIKDISEGPARRRCIRILHPLFTHNAACLVILACTMRRSAPLSSCTDRCRTHTASITKGTTSVEPAGRD